MILKLQPGVVATAKFSLCKTYRYTLTRTWTPGRPHVCFIGLNPSVADTDQDDRTIRKCIKFIHSWNRRGLADFDFLLNGRRVDFGGLLMLNIFAYRTTYPAFLFEAYHRGHDVTGGSWNSASAWLEHFERYNVTLVIAAWGKDGGDIGRARLELLASAFRPVHCLAKNKDGSPKHPLYIKDDVLPTRMF